MMCTPVLPLSYLIPRPTLNTTIVSNLSMQLSSTMANSSTNAVYAIGIWLAAGAAASLLGCFGLLVMRPQADYTAEMWAQQGGKCGRDEAGTQPDKIGSV